MSSQPYDYRVLVALGRIHDLVVNFLRYCKHPGSPLIDQPFPEFRDPLNRLIVLVGVYEYVCVQQIEHICCLKRAARVE